MDNTHRINSIASAVHERITPGARLLVAVAGAPGSGKSTIATELARRLNDQRLVTRVVPMDGFHLDNQVLAELGLTARKGAPETFDAAGFGDLLRRLKDRSAPAYAPVFDRTRDISIGGAVRIEEAVDVVVVEGNYLLLDEPDWQPLHDLWDLTVKLEVDLAEIRGRLIQRWLSHGLSRTAATRRAESNDIPNAKRVIEHSIASDLTV